MNVEMRALDTIKPYEKNAKKHDQTQIDNVAESIRQYGFVQPIVVDKDGIIVIGHCRALGAKKLGLKEVPCVCVDELTPEQVNALRIVDNKTNESDWDFDLLMQDLPQVDLGDFHFDFNIQEKEDEQDYEKMNAEMQERLESGEITEDDEEYQEFVEKFKPKKTTDDCYTPQIVYEAVADYVSERYGIKKEKIVRPFYPGADYTKENYKPGQVVVDNPPFSILAEILNFYNKNRIKFFLFAPHLTLFSSSSSSRVVCGVTITYANGANVNTSFVTNLENCAFRSAPKLYKMIDEANKENLRQQKVDLPKYDYPKNVITSTMIAPFSKYGIEFEVQRDECAFIRQLDSQKKSKKALFGSGFLISDRKKAEREKAEVWTLSERELEIIKGLK